jgi:hypothetical protein
MSALRFSLKHLSSFSAALALSSAAGGCQPIEPKTPEQPSAVAHASTPAEAPPASPHAEDERMARERASAWLGLVDRGQYAESWDAAAQLFQASTAKEQWTATLRGARGPFGNSSSRKLRATEYKTELEGAPAGEYVVVHYDSAFEHKPAAREVITLVKQSDDSWKVAGYFVE